MKHLKSFNESEEYSSDQFTPIDYEEFNKIYNDPYSFVEFTHNEKKELIKIGSFHGIGEQDYYGIVLKIVVDVKLKKEYHKVGSYITLFKLPDEWYYVGASGGALGTGTSYKCDEFEGLINCLNYIKNKRYD